MRIPWFLLLATAAALPQAAHAMDLRPGGATVQAGTTGEGTDSLTIGLVWPWTWRRETTRGEWSGITEAYVSYWNGRGAVQRESFTQLGLLPVLRYRFGHARAGWFVEGGIGISAMDRLYATRDKQFSTRLNFVDVAGVGRSFGAQGEHELSLRLSHVSNAGLKKPNPGENFLQLRYAARF